MTRKRARAHETGKQTEGAANALNGYRADTSCAVQRTKSRKQSKDRTLKVWPTADELAQSACCVSSCESPIATVCVRHEQSARKAVVCEDRIARICAGI
jgi:hypothetical protein